MVIRVPNSVGLAMAPRRHTPGTQRYFSENSVISPGTARQGRCVAKGDKAHPFRRSNGYDKSSKLIS